MASKYKHKSDQYYPYFPCRMTDTIQSIHRGKASGIGCGSDLMSSLFNKSIIFYSSICQLAPSSRPRLVRRTPPPHTPSATDPSPSSPSLFPMSLRGSWSWSSSTRRSSVGTRLKKIWKLRRGCWNWTSSSVIRSSSTTSSRRKNRNRWWMRRHISVIRIAEGPSPG